MRRMVGLGCSCIMIILLNIYVAHDISKAINLSSWQDMLALALDNPQKYFWNVTLCHIPIFFFLRAPYLKPIYQIRFMPNVFLFVMKKVALRSVVIAAIIYASYMAYAIGVKMTLQITPYHLGVFARLAAFSLLCNLMYFVMYWITKREILGVLGVLLLNGVFIMIISEIEFQFPVETVNSFNTNFMTIYSTLANALCLFLLYMLIKNGEVLGKSEEDKQ